MRPTGRRTRDQPLTLRRFGLMVVFALSYWRLALAAGPRWGPLFVAGGFVILGITAWLFGADTRSPDDRSKL